MSTYAERKHKTLHELAVLQALLDGAAPGSLSWQFRNRVYETLEKLPQREQQHWRQQYGEALKAATEDYEQYRERTREWQTTPE